MFTKIATLCLGLAMIFSLSSATMIESNNAVTADAAAQISPSSCSCFAADFKWKPNFQTLACDAFFKVGLVPQPCISTSARPKYEIKSVIWSFGDGTTGTGQSVYHIYGGACPAPPTIVCATVTAVVSNGLVKEWCTYSVCKAITLQ